jgi:hypothetical protein
MPFFRGFGVLVSLSVGLGPQTQPSYTAVVAGSGYQTPPPLFVAPGQITTFFVGGLPQTAAGLEKPGRGDQCRWANHGSAGPFGENPQHGDTGH